MIVLIFMTIWNTTTAITITTQGNNIVGWNCSWWRANKNPPNFKELKQLQCNRMLFSIGVDANIVIAIVGPFYILKKCVFPQILFVCKLYNVLFTHF